MEAQRSSLLCSAHRHHHRSDYAAIAEEEVEEEEFLQVREGFAAGTAHRERTQVDIVRFQLQLLRRERTC